MPEIGKEIYELTELESPLLSDDILLLWSTGEQAGRTTTVGDLGTTVLSSLDLSGLPLIAPVNINEHDLILVFDETNQQTYAMRVDNLLDQPRSSEVWLSGANEYFLLAGDAITIQVGAAAVLKRVSFSCNIVEDSTGLSNDYKCEYIIRASGVQEMVFIKNEEHSLSAETNFACAINAGLVVLTIHTNTSAAEPLIVNFFNISIV